MMPFSDHPLAGWAELFGKATCLLGNAAADLLVADATAGSID